MHDWAGLGQAMRSLLERHPLGRETALACLVPPGVGGFLLLPTPRDPSRDHAWIKRQLSMALPFPAEAVQYRAYYRDGWAEIFWVPNDWIKTQREFFAGLGLRLTELYPRAALFLDQAELTSGVPICLAEGMGNGGAWYCFEHGRVRKSLWLPTGDAQSFATAGAVICDGAREGEVKMEAGATLGRMLALWESGDEALCVNTAAWSVWKPFVVPLLTMGVLLVGLAGGVAWKNAEMERTQRAMLRESRELASVAPRFSEFERAVREEKARVAALRVLDDSPMPYETLRRVVELLPERAWVRRMVFDGISLSITGTGGEEVDLLRYFNEGGLEATPVRQETPASDTFEIRIKPLPAAEPESRGKS